ncbi:hypothetical protein BM526_19570 (plasmid) [Alteromonas mediterranea]|uniref:hypothetical protein n=1 Tax=Alteromonas mediterranea TaxID=314275 RepID=UPI000903798D|nr:hypothetical protein [Alteromonas mediterranea]APE04170.1 hypothetical protein BM526_19570 [Alteromonas mediterranea]
MNYVLETFSPAQHLPVNTTSDGMKLLAEALNEKQDSNIIFVAIGECEESTDELVCKTLKEHFQSVFTEALDEECEFIVFMLSDDDSEKTLYCTECGNDMKIDENGISNHIDNDGSIDYELDADHVAIAEE